MDKLVKGCLTNTLCKPQTEILLSLDCLFNATIWPWLMDSEAASKILRSDRGRSLLQKRT